MNQGPVLRGERVTLRPMTHDDAPALIDTLRAHKDYYTRLGAAVALGELRAADAVPALTFPAPLTLPTH